MEAKELGNKVGGEHSNKGIIVLHLFVELPSGIGSGVFAALKLGLKVEVVLVGLQVRILLDGDQQTRQSTRHLILGCLESFQVFFGEVFGIKGDRSGFGASFHHRCQRASFIFSIAFYCSYKVGNQVGTLLIGSLQITYSRSDSFFFGNHRVIATRRKTQGHKQSRKGDKDNSFHNTIRINYSTW